jgi:hypothetical protein
MVMADIDKMNMDACRKYQAHYDEHLSRHVGFQTPQPSVGENVNHYRARCMKMIAKRDPFGHETERVFIGPEHFVKQLTRPGRRVVSFNTPQGPMTPGGQYIRR